MQNAAVQDRDPLGWCAALALAFFALCLIRIGTPAKPYFDEVHYVPAARKLLELMPANREHPMFAKEILAASIHLLGDRPLAWRLPSVLFGTLGLFAFGRLVWWASRRRFAAIAAMLLLATNFMWFIQSRIAMLDIFAASLGLAGLWIYATAIGRRADAARPRLALCGVLIGLAIASKWSAAPLALVPGLAYAEQRLRHFDLQRRTGKPVARSYVSLTESALWLGVLPLAVYWATFAPAFFYRPIDGPIAPFGFIDVHRHMIELQDSVVRPHPYQSLWYQWIADWRPIWYLYEHADGAQRGVLLLGNPFTMLAGLLAVVWCLGTGIFQGRRDALAFALLYFLCLGMWVVSSKPIQFYYHYLLPGVFLAACLGLALDQLMRLGGKWRVIPFIALGGAAGMFVWFFPILSSAPLADNQAFVKWMWLESWR